jgi:hypothetical protein
LESQRKAQEDEFENLVRDAVRWHVSRPGSLAAAAISHCRVGLKNFSPKEVVDRVSFSVSLVNFPLFKDLHVLEPALLVGYKLVANCPNMTRHFTKLN